MHLSLWHAITHNPTQLALLLVSSFVFLFLIVFELILLLPSQQNQNAVIKCRTQVGNRAFQQYYDDDTSVLLPQSKHPKIASTNNSSWYNLSKTIKGHSHFTFNLTAVLFVDNCETSKTRKDNGFLNQYSSSNVDTSVIYNFSPQVKLHVKQMFPKIVRDETWFALYPSQVSCLPSKGVLNCVLRISLRLNRFHIQDDISNRFQDSFLYFHQLDHNLQYIHNSGKLISIPTPFHSDQSNGPEEPRLFEIGDELFLNFFNGHSEGGRRLRKRQHVWSVDKNVLHEIKIEGYKTQNFEEYNWAPWVDRNGSRVNFVYHFSTSLSVLRCQFHHNDAEDDSLSNFRCIIIPGDGSRAPSSQSFLRAGSPLVHYAESYFLTLTHSVQPKYPDQALIYGTQLALINAESKQIVCLSSPILIDPKTMAGVKTTAPSVGMPFLYPRSVFVENKNSIVFAACLNDNDCYLVRLRGIASILELAIENDSKVPQQSCKKYAYDRFMAMEGWVKHRNLAELNKYFKKRPDLEP